MKLSFKWNLQLENKSSAKLVKKRGGVSKWNLSNEREIRSTYDWKITVCIVIPTFSILLRLTQDQTQCYKAFILSLQDAVIVKLAPLPYST